MSVPRVICSDCLIEMGIRRTGACYEMFATWGSYYKIYVDEYQCRECSSVVALPGAQPAAIHTGEDYARIYADKQAATITILVYHAILCAKRR